MLKLANNLSESAQHASFHFYEAFRAISGLSVLATFDRVHASGVNDRTVSMRINWTKLERDGGYYQQAAALLKLARDAGVEELDEDERHALFNEIADIWRETSPLRTTIGYLDGILVTFTNAAMVGVAVDWESMNKERDFDEAVVRLLEAATEGIAPIPISHAH